MKRTTAVINFSAIVMLSALLGVGNSVAFHFGGTIDSFLSKKQIDFDDENVQNVLNSGKELAIEIEENGAVLLKNENDCLPLKNNKVNIFGWGGCDNGFLYQGGGSSEGGYSADKISLYDAFRKSGVEINESLAKDYNSLSYRREGGPDRNEHSVYYRAYEPGSDFYTSERMEKAKQFSDTAIMVFSRRATEGDDLPKVSYNERGDADTSRRYLSLTQKEAIMVKQVTDNFDHVICLFNSSAPMEMGFVDYDGIDAAMYIGYPGYYGMMGVVKLLKGESSPSGHITDTCAYDLRSAPSYVNSGPDATKMYTGKTPQGRYTDYAEDIYVGYKWYETADAEDYYDNAELDIYGKKRRGYDAVVQYPFGHGLSYTTFSQEIEAIVDQENQPLNNRSKLSKDDKITFKVWVENTGDVAGKEVVQLYYGAPYTKGGIEKAAVNLGAFAKTDLLEPGKGQLLELSVDVSAMASYDTYDKNNNEFMGYEVEAGDYTFSLRSNSHDVIEGVNLGVKGPLQTSFVVEEGFRYDTDPVTNNPVENLFTTFTNPVSGASSTIKEPQASYAVSIDGNDKSSDFNQNITYLTRADFAATFPKVTETRSISIRMVREVYMVHAPFIDENDVMPVTGSTETNWTLNDVKGLPYDDKKWNELISQLTVDEMANLVAHGGFGTNAIERIGKPKCTDSDGGTGFTSGIVSGDEGHATKYTAANILACTWDYKEAYKWGHAIGEEGKMLGIQGWYAPGCNVHRSPLGGRNFEYFSEDGVQAGIFCAYSVKGATENGVYCYMKHFAGNDTDEGRNGQFKWMTEQSFREIWAKPGEVATKVGGANALMVSVDRIGSVRATGSYAMLTSLLRDEWGFRGSCITDYYQGGQVNDIDEGIRAGNDLVLHPGGNASFFDDKDFSATTVIALQKSAHNILYTYIDTINRTEKFSGVDWENSHIGVKVEEKDGTWWRPTLISIDCALGVGLAAWGVVSYVFTWGRKRD